MNGDRRLHEYPWTRCRWSHVLDMGTYCTARFLADEDSSGFELRNLLEIRGITSCATTLVLYLRYGRRAVRCFGITRFAKTPTTVPTIWYSEVVAVNGALGFAILCVSSCPRLPDRDRGH